MIAATPGRWCTLYVDTPDEPVVVAAVTGLLGAGTELDVFTVPGFTVQVHPNPDRTGGPHPLDWPTLVEIDADADVPAADVAAFVARMRAHLDTAGLRTEAESDAD